MRDGSGKKGLVVWRVEGRTEGLDGVDCRDWKVEGRETEVEGVGDVESRKEK